MLMLMLTANAIANTNNRK